MQGSYSGEGQRPMGEDSRASEERYSRLQALCVAQLLPRGERISSAGVIRPLLSGRHAPGP